MTAHNFAIVKPQTLKYFDGELSQLHHLTLELAGLMAVQWDLLLEALDEANLESALDVIALNHDIRECGDEIQQIVLNILAKTNPVAEDVRVLISISKISTTMVYFSDEIAKTGKLILSFYEPRNGIPSARLLGDIVRIGEDIGIGLDDLANVLKDGDTEKAHKLLRGSIEFDQAIQGAVQQQFIFINQDLRQVGVGLTLLQILNSLESCRGHCKNLAEYCIFMIDDQDVRHTMIDQVH